MANLLNRYKNTSSRLPKKRRYDDVDYVSRIDAGGDFHRIYDIEVLISSWTNILETPTRTYIFDPTYGSDLYKLIWEPTDDKTYDAIEREVEEKLTTYDNRGIIDHTDIKFLPNQKGFSVDVYFTYAGEKGQLSVIMSEDKYFNILRAV